MSTYQEQYKCASEEMVVQVNQMLTMFTIDLAQYRTGKFDGRCNAGVTFDAMQKTVGQAKYHMNRSIDVMSRIHDPPLTCVPGKCVVCHALSTLHNLKIYAEGFETYVDNHRRAMAEYGVHCDNLKAEFKSFLDIGIQDCGHLLWMGNFLVKVHSEILAAPYTHFVMPPQQPQQQQPFVGGFPSIPPPNLHETQAPPNVVVTRGHPLPKMSQGPTPARMPPQLTSAPNPQSPKPNTVLKALLQSKKM